MKFNVKIFLIIEILILSISLNAQNPGIRYIQLEQYSEAKSYFLKQIFIENSAVNYFELSNLFLAEENADSAKYFLNAAVAKYPDDALLQTALVKYFVFKNNPDSAARALNKALSLSKSRDQKVLLELAEAYYEFPNNNFEKSLELLTTAKEIDKTSVDLYIYFGRFYLKQNKNGEAANQFQRINYYHPENPDGYFLYGKVYFNSGNLNESSSALLKAVGLDSAYSPAWRILADLYANFGYYKEAVTYYSKYMSLIKPGFYEHSKFATYLHFNKDFKSSLEEAKIAIETDPKNFVIRRIIAYNYFELKDYKSALSAINQFYEIVPSEKIISSDYEYFGKILSKNSQDSLALIKYFKALEMDTSKTSLFENIGTSYEKTKNYSQAVVYFQKLIDSRTQAVSTDFYYLGRNAYFYGGSINDSIEKLKYFSLADTSFAKVVLLNPNSSIGYFWRARVNTLLDPESEQGFAKPYYEKAAELMELNTEKYKKDLIESYQYLGYFYYLKQDNENSKIYWNKILTIDPENETALKALKGIK